MCVCVCIHNLTSSGALMVKEDSINREEVISLSEVHHYPVCVELRSTYQTWAQREGVRIKVSIFCQYITLCVGKDAYLSAWV